MPIKNWSTTAASNNSSPPNGAPEGMAPSTVNDIFRQQMADHRTQWQEAEWFDWGDAGISRASVSTFKITGDVTTRYLANRRIKCYDTTTLYGTVTTSSYSAPDTTVTVSLDSGSLSASLTSIAIAILSPTSRSIPSTLYDESNPIKDTSNNELLKFSKTSSAVNEVTVTNQATGSGPSIAATGDDTNIPMTLKAKGTGAVILGQATSTDLRLAADQPIGDSSGNELIKFTKAVSAVNEVTVANAATGANPSLTATGGDSNIGMDFQGKGTGVYNFKATADQATKLRLFEDTDNGSNYIEFLTPASLTGNRTITLPDSDITLSTPETPSWKFIASATASASATIDFSSITASSYSAHMIIFNDVAPATDSVDFYFRMSTGASFKSGASDYTYTGYAVSTSGNGAVTSGGATFIPINDITNKLGTGSNETASGKIIIYNAANASTYKRIYREAIWYSDAPVAVTHNGGGTFVFTTACDGFRFLMSSGNIASGTFYLYGLRTS